MVDGFVTTALSRKDLDVALAHLKGWKETSANIARLSCNGFPVGVLRREMVVISQNFLKVCCGGVLGMTMISLLLGSMVQPGEYCMVGAWSGGFSEVFQGSWADATFPVEK